MTPSKKQRIESIDVFRALTMLLMIFVNDLWTVTNVPKWLEHTAAEEDGMGLADTVFPAFLFIVGLSIPFAFKKLSDILWRSLALLVMGFFHVNMENYPDASAWLPKPVWMILLTCSFFLIWLDYARRQWVLQGLGVVLLVFLAVAFNAPMKPYWWGILGLIGWAYLICAGLFWLLKGRLVWMVAALLVFLVVNIMLYNNAAFPTLTMAGVVAALCYKHKKMLIAWGIVMIVAGFMIRPWEGISKVRATPAWVMICMGISLLVFMIIDLTKKEHWFKLIKPGGTSTLTAYLLPYIFYGLGIQITLSGAIGLLKSLLFAFGIILLTGLLEKKRIRLKI